MRLYGRAAAALLTGTLMLLSLAAPGVSAQQAPTLGEIARREAERRKALKTDGKVYTNKDLPKSSATPAPPSTPPPAAAPTAEQKPATQKPAEAEAREKDKDREEEKNEAWWRKRMTAARDALQRHELAADAFQSRINALTTDFVNRDDPYQRAQISIDRQKALNELERMKAEMVRIKQQIADIEEEARVSGVPPGWLR